MKTEVDVPNANLQLVPGMYAEVDLITEQRQKVLAVPVEAIDGSGDSTRVFAGRFTWDWKTRKWRKCAPGRFTMATWWSSGLAPVCSRETKCRRS
jgi:hypothetical protein